VQNQLELPFFGVQLSILWIYLMLECTISGVMISFVRGAKIWKGLLFYSLTMMLVSTIVFEAAKMIASSMLTSATAATM